MRNVFFSLPMSRNKPYQLITREWEDLRYCFEMCGDIGDVTFEDLKDIKWLVGEEYESFISKIIKMDEKLSQYGYATSEALYVFTVLAMMAAKRLGLISENLAFNFGMGYGFVRTGLISYDRLEPMQVLFFKIFFPLGGTWDIYWGFDPCLVKEKLSIVFNRFMSWQNNPQGYKEDFARGQNIGEL
ncbi:MAG: hypothetical protein WBD99_04720, partial [Thermodesulfobacteriota bacterium]